MDREYTFTHAGATREVCVVGDSSEHAVLLMHELPGLTDPAIEFAGQLAAIGIAVHMPLFFGKPRQSGVVGGLFPGGLQTMCIRREFAVLASDHSSPIGEWLRALARSISAESGGKPIGVVGMCLSGGWVFSLVLDYSVGAGIVSQPSTPFRPWSKTADYGAVGESEDRIQEALQAGKPLLAMHFESDRSRCPPAKLDSLRQAYTEAGSPSPAPILRQYAGKGHSVVAASAEKARESWRADAPDPWDKSQTPRGPDGRRAAIDFLTRNLGINP